MAAAIHKIQSLSPELNRFQDQVLRAVNPLLKSAAQTGDRSFIRVDQGALKNGWTYYGGDSEYAVAYRKNADGLVTITGRIAAGTVPSLVFTLPGGYRPSAETLFAVDANGAFGNVNVATNGDVSVHVGDNTVVSLNLSFYAEP